MPALQGPSGPTAQAQAGTNKRALPSRTARHTWDWPSASCALTRRTERRTQGTPKQQKPPQTTFPRVPSPRRLPAPHMTAAGRAMAEAAEKVERDGQGDRPPRGRRPGAPGERGAGPGRLLEAAGQGPRGARERRSELCCARGGEGEKMEEGGRFLGSPPGLGVRVAGWKAACTLTEPRLGGGGRERSFSALKGALNGAENPKRVKKLACALRCRACGRVHLNRGIFPGKWGQFGICNPHISEVSGLIKLTLSRWLLPRKTKYKLGMNFLTILNTFSVSLPS